MGSRRHGAALVLAGVLVLSACLSPEDDRPGLGLSGELAVVPSDWSFTNDSREISVEVKTPYLLPHSVTIWCAEVDGALFIGARNPESKRWPGWVDADPDVRLKIGERVYEVTLRPDADPQRVEQLRAAFAAKYALPEQQPGKGTTVRYWQVAPRG